MQITWDEAVAPPPAAAAEQPITAKKGQITWDQVYPAFEEEARKGPSVLGSVGRSAADLAIGAGKLGLATADMLLGAPAALAGWFVGTGTQAYAAAKGESPKIQGMAAEMAEVLPEIPVPGTDLKIPLEVLKTPLQSVMKIFTGEEPYDQEIVSKSIERGSEAIEKTGVMTAESARRLLSGWMNMAFVKAGPSLIKAATERKPGLGREAKATYREEPPATTPDGVPLENPDPARYRPAYDAEGKLSGWEDSSKPVSAAEAGAISSKEVKAIFDRAKKGEALKEADVNEVSKFFEAARKRGQTGEIDPLLKKTLGAFAGGAAAGTLGVGAYKLYQEWQRHKELIDQLELENKSWRNLEERRQQEEEKQKNPDQELLPKKKPFVTAEATAGLTALLVPAMMRVKGTGIWSDRAKVGLGGSLTEGMTQGFRSVDPAAVENTWSTKRVTDYLNRWAGTAEDPLRDIKIPVGDEMVRWEDVTDKAFEAARIPERLELMKQGKAEMGEPIWSLAKKDTNYVEGAQEGQAAEALKSYISHMGDFARLNIPPEKLGQYDFVRLAKETAANDARVAKLAEKARVASSKELPLVKEYPDGQRWVEIKAPEKLTTEQGKRVRRLTPQELRQWAKHSQHFDEFDTPAPKETRYVAIDAAGKNVVNNYTQSPAYGATPHEAWLAGRLAEEGNVMGHCVGGYCADVFAGQSRIFSLRGKDGESHVTVEMAPNLIDASSFSGGYIKGKLTQAEMIAEIKKLETNPEFHAGLPRKEGRIDLSHWIDDIQKRYPNTNPDILQIKGKQNRAPDSRYLPAVQDFVKTQGPWGEVGDLGNTGLTDIRQSKINSGPFRALSEELHPGQDFLTPVEYERHQAEGVKRTLKAERGASTPEHMVAIAAAGSAAAYFAANPDKWKELAAGSLGIGIALGVTKGKGDLVTLYHGTTAPEFPRFRASSFLTPVKEFASQYAEWKQDMGANEGPPRVIVAEAALRKMATPADVWKVAEPILKKAGIKDEWILEYKERPLFEIIDLNASEHAPEVPLKVTEALKQKGFRGVTLIDEAPYQGPGSGSPTVAETHVMFYPDDISIVSQRGASTPEHMVALAGGAVGALIGMQDSDSPIRSGIYGAIAGLALGHPAGRAALKTIIKSPDVALGAISTRLGNMHPALKLMERRHELNILRQIDQLNDQVLPFAQAFDKLPKEQQLAAGRMLMNGQESMLQTIASLAPTLPGLRRALASVEGQLKGLGRFKEGLSGYFPRMVSDLEGLKKALGGEHAIGIEKALVNAEAESVRKAGRGLTDVEQSLVVNRYLHAADQTSFQPGYAKGRRVGEVTPELQPFYEPPVESLLRYISGAVSDIQTAKFFGRDLKVNKKGMQVHSDVDGSIGNLAARLTTEGKITREQGLELREILKARFEGGDKGMSQGLAAARNLTNTALLGNFASAATQVGDSLTSIYHQGTVPIIQSLAQKLVGRQRITPKQLGLINHVAEELSEMGITGRALHNTMKYSGFHAIDMFAKGLLLNASLTKNTKLAQTPKGTAQLIERYGQAFGDEMPQLLEDLRAKRMSQNVETLAFSELSDAQPVSKAEMSEAYLRHPNGRILYQLKTYMLKQVDVVRRDAYQNIAAGNPKRIMIGAKNLAALGAVYALANVPGDVIKDVLAGRDVDPFTTPKLVENVLQTFGINRYAQEQLLKGKVVETAQGLLTPPVRVFQDIGKTLHESGGAAPDWKGASYIPLVGRPAYERWLGGNERREISEKRSANTGAPKSERQTLSPEAKEYLRQKNLAAKEKRLQREQR